MTNYKWQTQYKKHDVIEETNNLPSKTVPNEVMSIREILVRYSRGLPIDQKVPMYEEEQFLPDIKHMDLADVQTLRENIQEEIKQRKEKAETEHKQNVAKKQLEAQQRKENEKLALLKELKETQP